MNDNNRSGLPRKIEFVCTGNICRSPLAHRMFEKKAEERGVAHKFEVESSGTDAWHVGEQADSRMIATARAHGWKLSHRSRRISRRELQESDLVIVMASGHRRELERMARDAEERAKIRLFREFDPHVNGSGHIPDVPDPWYGDREGFEEVYEMVERTCDALLDALERGDV